MTMAFGKAGLAVLGWLVLAAPPATAEEDGAELFSTWCAACHNQDGTGNPGLAPPLNRAGFWAGLGDQAPVYLAGVMTQGMAGTLTIQGQVYAGLIMPPVQGPTDAELVALGDYVLTGLGGTPVTFGQQDLDRARTSRPSHADLRAMRPMTE